MTEVGIPVYQARDTLPKALDSLVAQTTSDFIVCLSIDGDNIDYSDIIDEYIRRGLKIRVVYSEVNQGPGAARQKIIDTTECEYIMFLDSDDMLMPYGVQSLTNAIISQNFDMVRSSFSREDEKGINTIIPHDVPTITWLHGKIYRVGYLKERGLRFRSDLRAEEDAYFNILCWNAADRRGETSEITYAWRYNPKSITRIDSPLGYFKKHYDGYIFSQVEALKRMPYVMKEVSSSLILQTMVNIYNHYMLANYLKLPLEETDKEIQSLINTPLIMTCFSDPNALRELLKYVKPGQVIEDEVVYYEYGINEWLVRLFNEKAPH